MIWYLADITDSSDWGTMDPYYSTHKTGALRMHTVDLLSYVNPHIRVTVC